IQQLDEIPELDGLETYLQVLIRNTKENYPDYDFTKGSPKIPKKIHYIWVGGKKLPDEFQRNIDTWKKYNPDYEIIRWDESNYDFNKCDYVREAYESKSWGFVPNFARLDIIWQNGGIYLDTDVEVVQNFDVLLNDQAFLCMGTTDRVNNGCGFGAVPHHPMIKELKKVFEKEHFIVNGKPGRKPCHTFLHPILRKYGFQINNNYQNINGTVLYPKEVMSPLSIQGMPNFLSDKTVSIHKEEGTWKNEKEKSGILKLQNLIEKRIVTYMN
ncbi:MAG: hypothetical protein K6E51_14790, partial [Treponema sp.]|nr:hypothetical protein [Treponema sp.]